MNGIDPAQLRLSDSEREAASRDLAEHFAQGRLTRDEYDERSDAVWTAKHAEDLAPLFVDLPHGSPVVVRASFTL